MLFGPKGPFCQSCGMPLSKDKNGGGTNADGTKSAEYCSNCFQSGQFTEPNVTMEQMQEKVKDKIVSMGFPRFMAGYMSKNIPTLKRWAKN